MKKENLTKRQRRVMENAKKVPLNLRNLTQIYEAQGIVGSTPAEQCEAARRHNEERFGKRE